MSTIAPICQECGHRGSERWIENGYRYRTTLSPCRCHCHDVADAGALLLEAWKKLRSETQKMMELFSHEGASLTVRGMADQFSGAWQEMIAAQEAAEAPPAPF
jgi:hypothetical protein